MLTFESFLNNSINNIITEGGAAGHMLHPWALEKIVTLDDLVNYYYDLIEEFHSSERTAFVKIDGTNVSLRLRDNEFVIDRLTTNPLDIAGVSINDVDTRFVGNKFGYDGMAKQVLTMFNDALPDILPLLKKMGFVKNPNLMLNIEFVDGKTNKVDYKTKFICIHNVMEIQTSEKGVRKTSLTKFDEKTLDKIAEILNDKFGEYDFECFVKFPAIMTDKPEFETVLKEQLTINGIGTKKLGEWIRRYSGIKINKTAQITLADGTKKSVTAISLMNKIRTGADVTKLISEKHLEKAIIAFLMMYINCEFGYAVLDCFENKDLGKMSSQEGIVIYDYKLNGIGVPVKITGKFIYQD